MSEAAVLHHTDARWRAVLARDRRADGQFVYAVRSTGIFCRPTCPSRRPAPHQVSFFSTPEEAGAAGYRACRRCHPEQATPDASSRAVVERAARAIAEQGGKVSLATLARRTGTTAAGVRRAFTHHLGVTPQRYAEALRLGRLRELLKNGASVTHAQFEAGFGSSSRLYERTHDRLGMTPASYKKGGRGLTIAYATGETPVGRVLVARTDRGVCAVRLGATDRALVNELEREFHAATLTRRDTVVRGNLRTVVAALTHPDRAGALAGLPLDVRATAFQARVWNALRAIPAGQTRSYQAIAKSLGRPGASRAVGRACASNPVALLIPCHRVVRGDGALGGYRWGLDRKAALLEREGQP